MIQARKGRNGKVPQAPCYVNAFHEQLAERLRHLEGGVLDHEVVQSLVFLEQVTKQVDRRLLGFGKREDETAVNIHFCFPNSHVLRMEEVSILKTCLFLTFRVFDTLPFGF